MTPAQRPPVSPWRIASPFGDTPYRYAATGALIILTVVVLAAVLCACGPVRAAPYCPGRPAGPAIERTAQ